MDTNATRGVRRPAARPIRTSSRAAAAPSSTSARSSTSSASSATSPTAPPRPRSARSRAASRWSGRRRSIRVLDVAPGYIVTELNAEAMARGPLRAFLEKRIPGRRPGHRRGRGAAGRRAVRRGHRLPHRRDDLPRRRPGHRALMHERLRAPGRPRSRWTEEERMLLESVRTLAREQIAPRAEHYDRSAEFPWDNVKAINALGLNAMFIPEAYGGAPLSYAAYLACVREISKACASTGIIWATNFHAHEAADRFRHRGAEAAPAAARSPQGGLGVARHHRARRGLGRHRHEDALSRPRATTSSSTAARPSSPTATSPTCILLFGKWSEIADERKVDLGAGPREGHAGPLGGAQRGQDGAPRLEHRDARLRRLPRAARQPARQARRRPEDPARLAQQVAPERRRACARHRARRVRGRGRLHQRARASRAGASSSSRASSSCWPTWPPSSRMCEAWLWHVARLVDGGAQDFGIEASMLKMRASRPRDAHRHRRGAAARRLRLLQGLPRRAADARRQDHPDLGRHQPDPPPADRAQLHRKR